MSERGTELLAEAMRLPDSERADFVAQLVDSIDPATDGDQEAAWSKEIQTRMEELDSGRVQAIAWPEARLRIHL